MIFNQQLENATMSQATCQRCPETSQGWAPWDSNPQPTDYISDCWQGLAGSSLSAIFPKFLRESSSSLRDHLDQLLARFLRRFLCPSCA